MKHEAEDLTSPHLNIIHKDYSQRYINHFHAQLTQNDFVPNQKHYPKPKIHGFHNAIVIGAEKNTIHTDKLGRIQVKFSWTLSDKNSDQRSCWLRVVQQQVGHGWGVHFLPRVGQEVQISFEQSDIDRPICIGSLYNSLQQTPYPLPECQAVSGFKTCRVGTNSSRHGHELQFNDRPGQEAITIQVKNQLVESVNRDATSVIGHNEIYHVTGNKMINIGKTATYQAQKKLQLVGQGGTISIEPDCISITGIQINMN